MRILFICGSLEFGVDGVGDYTRRLSTELIKQGHEVAALALFDQFVSDHVKHTENNQLQIFRIPITWTDDKRFKVANKCVNNFDPEWLSLQFVPFSFDTKGLPFGLGTQLKKLGTNRKWHIMFHELWVGMEKTSTIKYILWAEVQKYLIKNLIKELKPLQIHTQTKLYQIQLNKLGYKADYLPLYSNIPVITKSTKRKEISNRQNITFINFGTIHPDSLIRSFAQNAVLYAKEKEIEIDLILIGRCGSEQKQWIDICKSVGLKISVLKEQSVDRISKTFSNASFGISTTALPLIEKSGSVAAMHEHNLPVICIAKPWYPRGIKNLPIMPNVIEFNNSDFKSCINTGNNMIITAVEISKISTMLVESFILSKD